MQFKLNAVDTQIEYHASANSIDFIYFSFNCDISTYNIRNKKFIM